MKRLTDIDTYCAFMNCDLEGCISEKCYDKKIYDKLQVYEELEEQGLLLRLPCKVGQTVYAFGYPRTDIVVEEEVEKILVWENGMSIETDGGYYPLDEIGVCIPHQRRSRTGTCKNGERKWMIFLKK